MKLDTYEKAESLKKQIDDLQKAKEMISLGGLSSQALAHIKSDKIAMDRLKSSALAIITIRLKELNNEFLQL